MCIIVHLFQYIAHLFLFTNDSRRAVFLHVIVHLCPIRMLRILHEDDQQTDCAFCGHFRFCDVCIRDMREWFSVFPILPFSLTYSHSHSIPSHSNSRQE